MKKTLLIILCVIAVAAASVMGTLAYLTDTDSAVNTFTVGKVGIKLDETLVDTNGDPILDDDGNQQRTEKTETTENGNTYHLLPGKNYTKDPMITVDAGSEESYIRTILTIHNASAVQAILDNHAALTDFSDLIGGWDETKWLYQGFASDEDANTISFEFRYYTTVDGYDEEGAEAEQALEPLFNTLVVPGVVTGEELAALYVTKEDGTLDEDASFKMVVTGHAIQATGFNDEDAAWVAFDEQIADAPAAPETPSESEDPESP